MEDRVARLEVNVEHIQNDVSALAINMEKQFGALRTARAFDRAWYLLMTASLLGIMGRAFKWF